MHFANFCHNYFHQTTAPTCSEWDRGDLASILSNGSNGSPVSSKTSCSAPSFSSALNAENESPGAAGKRSDCGAVLRRGAAWEGSAKVPVRLEKGIPLALLPELATEMEIAAFLQDFVCQCNKEEFGFFYFLSFYVFCRFLVRYPVFVFFVGFFFYKISEEK